MLQIKEVILLENTPVPVPSLVFVDRAVVGLIAVSQTTPRVVTEAPPPEVTFPPPDAVVLVILVIGEVVVTVGAIGVTEHEVFVYVPDIVPAVHVLV